MAGAGSTQARRQQAADLLLGNAAADADPQSHLREVFEELAGQCTERLGGFAPVPMKLTFREVVSGTSGDALGGYGESAVVGSLPIPDRNAPIMIGADRAFMDAAVEAVFGSDGSEPASAGERAPTRLEMRLAGEIFEQIAEPLRLSMFGANAAPLELERVETVATLPATVRRDEPSCIARFGLSTLERAGELFIALPQSAIRGGRQTSRSAVTAAPATSDLRWSRRIEQEVQRTQVTLQAVLDERELTLADIAELRVGQVLPLKATPRSNVKVVCNDQMLFWCELGQTEGLYTLRIKDFPDEEQELIDAITSQ